jgi:hypothetical protein
MTKSPLSRLSRWLLPLAAGVSCLLTLVVELWTRLKTSEAGLINTVGQAFNTGPTRDYVAGFGLGILLPFYTFMGLLLWILTLAWGAVWHRGWSKDWRALEGFGFALSALLWTHLVLWWEVPATLWTLPGLRLLPFWLLFPLLALLALAYPARWSWTRLSRRWLALPLLAGWLVLWSLVPQLPGWLPRWHSPVRGGQDKAEVLMIGLDGLRYDVGQEATQAWEGRSYEFAYTPIPATRLLWHILWGGDPLYYTVGHAPPAMEEYGSNGVRIPLPLLEEAKAKGWKPRFYIDDGGTIGLAGRAEQFFDDTLMPARGWENFVNSNLSVNFPLYAAWENWARAFPTTNPWAPLDGGLREALRQGRGSKWVMFHSCLAHQPIYLHRNEMNQLPHWWTAIPRNLEPLVVRAQVNEKHLARWDRRGDPFKAYQIRMQSILNAWAPIWANLAKDPAYQNSIRILFSDHGERFYHVADGVQLCGIHGYNLDPWETRVMLKVAGPRFSGSGPALDRESTVSLLGIRDSIAGLLRQGKPITPGGLEKAYPQAPMRYHTLSISDFTQEPAEYKQMNTKDLIKGTYIAPYGIWFTQYEKPAEERAKELTLGLAERAVLRITKPLKDGGAHLFEYQGFRLNAITAIDQKAYEAERQRSEKLLRSIPSLEP